MLGALIDDTKQSSRAVYVTGKAIMAAAQSFD